MLVDGKWTTDWQPVQAKDEKAACPPDPSLRDWVTPDGAAGPTAVLAAEAGRYHLYVALICPGLAHADRAADQGA